MDSGYTVVNNDTLWVDLSCRALGLLVRWLSKPAGVEVDTIPDIITRAKRRGNKRMEGRDALYTASYELEEEGFLVRRLFTNERGQHEWAAFVRSRPVPPEDRSDPADRKRPAAKPRNAAEKVAAKASAEPEPPAKAAGPPGQGTPDAASSQVNPNPGNPDSGDPVPGNPIPGKPDSVFQGSSYQSSLNSSLSQDAPDTGGSSCEEEREAATPNNDSSPSSPESTSDTDKVVDAYIAAFMTTAGMPPRPNTIQSIRTSATALLSVGRSVDNLCTLVAELAAKGWTDLTRHAQMNPEAAAKPVVVRKPWCGECNDGREPMAASQRMRETSSGAWTKCHCHPGYVPAPAPVTV